MRGVILGIAGLALFGVVACEEVAPTEELGEQSQHLDSNERILGFERVSATPSQSDWFASNGLLGAQQQHTEGSQSLGVANIGWTQLESAPLVTLGAVTNQLSFDLFVPGAGTIPWGDTQVFLDSPQLEIWNQPIGQKLLGGTTAGVFQPVELPLSSSLVTKLSSSGYTDLSVRIALNVPQTSSAVLIDKLSFGQSGSGGAGGSGSGGTASGTGGASAGSAGQSGGSGGSSGAGAGGSAGSGASSGSGTGGADVGPCVLSNPSPGPLTPYEFVVKLPAGVSKNEVLLGATGGRVMVDDRVRLMSTSTTFANATSVAATSTSRVGVEAEVRSVWSDQNLDLANRAHVHGAATSSQSVLRQPDTIVDGDIRELTSIAPLQTIDWTVHFPTNHRGSCDLQPSATQQIRPGAYGDYTIKSGARLKLTPGSYYFSSLTLEPSAILELQNTEAIVVYVRNAFVFKGVIQEAVPRGNVLFGVAGSSGATIAQAFRGVVVAPWGAIDLATTSAGHVGAFFGREVTAHQSTTLTLRPFEPGTLCGEDSSCGSFCRCDEGNTCSSNADCEQELVCSPGRWSPLCQGSRHQRVRASGLPLPPARARLWLRGRTLRLDLR